MRRVSPGEARERLHGGGEVAFLDLREAGQFGEGHPLFAVPLPFSRLEARIGALAPRRGVPVLLIDAGDGVAERAALRLAALGYRDLAVVAGGAPGWEAAGLTLYKGVNVPSKTLGELAEAVWHPPMLSAETLAEWRAAGRRVALFDARPPAEYAKMRVPGAVCLPNGELAHRLGVLGGDAAVVVTCAGRTRGITGVIGLRAAGHDGPVHALENGTQGWALAGFGLERGNAVDAFPALGADAAALSRRRAEALMRRYGIAAASAEEVAGFLGEPERTTYLLDVRSAEEVLADPVAAARHAPSGQIVQATDQWVGVRRSRIVLADGGGLRAALAAFWLKQLGYEALVARIDDPLRRLEPADAPPIPSPARIGAAEALAAMAEGAVALDLRGSMEYRRGHVRGAVWAIRPRLGGIEAGRVVLIGEDEAVAPAAGDLAEAGVTVLGAVEHEALVGAGAEVEASPDRPSDAEAIDHLFFVHDRHDGNLEASRRYLDWETGLVGALDASERAEFRLFGP